MRRAPELLMYAAFSAAALPCAWLGVRTLLYYRAHPEMLEVRDSAPEVLAAMGAVLISGIGLLVAAGLASYVLVVGPLAARASVGILVIAWIACFLAPATPFRSFQRLYWEALSFAALVILPWICAAARLILGSREATPRHDRAEGLG
jgi:hypothetical protein